MTLVSLSFGRFNFANVYYVFTWPKFSTKLWIFLLTFSNCLPSDLIQRFLLVFRKYFCGILKASFLDNFSFLFGRLLLLSVVSLGDESLLLFEDYAETLRGMRTRSIYTYVNVFTDVVTNSRDTTVIVSDKVCLNTLHNCHTYLFHKFSQIYFFLSKIVGVGDREGGRSEESRLLKNFFNVSMWFNEKESFFVGRIYLVPPMTLVLDPGYDLVVLWCWIILYLE